MAFIWPWLLLTLLLVPILIWGYFRLLKRRQAANAALGSFGLVQTSSRKALGKRRHFPFLFFLAGLSFLFLALARPETTVSLPRVEGTVILAFDISNSMLAEDLEPTRMDAAKKAARLFVEKQPSTIRIGVVAFSTGGLVVQKPTDDQAAVLATIERITPQGGTSLGQGIHTALNAIAGETVVIDAQGGADQEPAFQLEEFSSAVVVLLTDGENTEPPEPLEIAQAAADAGVRIFPVGIGSEAGTTMAIDGFNIVTQLDGAILEEIANVTNGRYYQAADEQSLAEIYENIDLQLTIAGEKIEITAIIAGIGVLFLLIGGALSLLLFGRVP
jgi:Ca-activated chloride channel family protein